MIKRRLFIWLSLSFFLGLHQANAVTFSTLIDHSLGYDAINHVKSGQFNLQIDALLVDGQVFIKDVESRTFDRTAINYTRIWGEFSISPRFSMRLSLWTKAALRKEEGEFEPRKITEESWGEGRVGLEGTFITQSKLELFFGSSYYGISEFTRTSESANVKTNWKYSQVAFPVFHIGIVKRSGFAQGGFYHRQGGQRDRIITKSAELGDEFTLTETVHLPTMVGVFFRLKLGAGGFVFGEFSDIQGSEGGNKTDDGDSVTEDHALLRFIHYFPFGPFGLRTSLIHKTLSYADNRNITIDTIPMSTLHLKFLAGGKKLRGFLGIIYGHGSDVQSIPEFNAELEVVAFGGSAGLLMEL